MSKPKRPKTITLEQLLDIVERRQRGELDKEIVTAIHLDECGHLKVPPTTTVTLNATVPGNACTVTCNAGEAQCSE